MTREVGASATSRRARAHRVLGDGDGAGASSSPPSSGRVPSKVAYHALPFVLRRCVHRRSLLSDGDTALGVVAFGLAGLGCSALLPLTISLGQEELTAVSAGVAGGVIAFYQLGYGLAAFGTGPSLDHGVGLLTIFKLAAVVAVCMGASVVRRRPRPAEPVSLHPHLASPDRGGDMDAYDVIIIGTGAGGGTLARHLAPSGKRILLLERGDWLPREPQNWLAQDVFVDNRYVSDGHLVRRRGASRSSRRSTTSSAARRSSTARRSTACAPRTSASSGTTTGSRPPGRSPTTSSSPTTRRPSRCTRSTARAARTRPRGRPALRIRSRPSRTSRGSSSSPTTSRPPATTRSTRRAGSGSTRRTCRTAPASAARTATAFPCVVHGKSDADVLGVRPALEHPNVTLLDERRGGQARDEPRRHGGHGGRRRA